MNEILQVTKDITLLFYTRPPIGALRAVNGVDSQASHRPQSSATHVITLTEHNTVYVHALVLIVRQRTVRQTII